MKPPVFEYYRPASADEAVELLASLGEDAKLLAGGQSLVAMMNFRLARPSALIDISRLDELRFVRRDNGSLLVGALARHRDLEFPADPVVFEGYSVLPRAARQIGHYVIRQSGTFGGSIAHADPAAEWCMVALLLDAEIGVLGPEGRHRTVPVGRFFQGFLTTDLAADEMIVDVRLAGSFPRVGFQEFARRHGDFAIVAAGAALSMDGGTIKDARVVLGGVGGAAVRSAAAEEILRGADAGPDAFRAAGEAASSDIDPPADLQGSPEYRRQLAAVLVRRALDEAVARDD